MEYCGNTVVWVSMKVQEVQASTLWEKPVILIGFDRKLILESSPATYSIHNIKRLVDNNLRES